MVLRQIPENTCKYRRARRTVQLSCHQTQAPVVVGEGSWCEG